MCGFSHWKFYFEIMSTKYLMNWIKDRRSSVRLRKCKGRGLRVRTDGED